MRDSQKFHSVILHWNFFPQMVRNFTISPLYPLITHPVLFHRRHGYISILIIYRLYHTYHFKFLNVTGKCGIWAKYVESIYLWQSGETIFWSPAPSKTQNFLTWAQPWKVLEETLYELQFSGKRIAKWWEVCIRLWQLQFLPV